VYGEISIPFINHARATSFLCLNSKAQKCLTYIKCSPAVFEIHKQNIESSISIIIFYQNILRIERQSDELIHSFEIR
jgi:hypothetical protein